MTFIKLTNLDKTSIYYNVNNITYFGADTQGTYVFDVSNSSVATMVKETPEEIVQKLRTVINEK